MKGCIELGSESECNYCKDKSDVMYTDIDFDGRDSQEVTYLYLCSNCDGQNKVSDDFGFKMSLHDGENYSLLN